jgi:hypothetical protein
MEKVFERLAIRFGNVVGIRKRICDARKAVAFLWTSARFRYDETEES